jgi:hypothetical protein
VCREKLPRYYLRNPLGGMKPENLTFQLVSGALKFGGERGIRTLEAFRLTHFPGVLLQPLGHLTGVKLTARTLA